jgi:protein-disulfide isomerase
MHRRDLLRLVGPDRLAAGAAALAGWELAGALPPVLRTAHAQPITPALLKALRDDPATPVIGNPLGHNAVVEFSDYRCPYCRMMQSTVASVIATNPGLRVACKEWPIFGGVSIYAARVALAANWQGRYPAVRSALFALAPSMDEASVRQAAVDAGIDSSRLAADLDQRSAELDALLAGVASEAAQLGVHGTPVFVIGTTVVPGALSEPDFADLVHKAET